jgi:glycosyltransferase involved in cell wall biosynthesis
MIGAPRCAVVAIGRNEGERLIRCFESIGPDYPAVYVDSGSSDGSVAEAERRGILVVNLPTAQGFTAARARNAGWRAIAEVHPDLEYIQFVDGDCEFAPGWIGTAIAALDAEAGLCAVFGRRRERFPQASLYNALCDEEWNVPVGLVEACGGDVLFRLETLRAVDGYSDDLIAGEEPDLCLRLGARGWKIRRIDAEMTRHDAAILRMRQQWLRTRRAGHAYAEHCARHGPRAFASWRRQLRSILAWTLGLPAALVALALAALLLRLPWLGGVAALLVLAYPAKIAQLALRKWRSGASPALALADGYWLVVGKFAQLSGVVQYWRNRVTRQRNQLIEYKGPAQ